MIVIHKGRGQGKTIELIKHASEARYTIVCLDQRMKEYTKRLAEKLGLKIPEPVTVEELRSRPDRVLKCKEVSIAVDDADVILERFLGVRIHEITLS